MSSSSSSNNKREISGEGAGASSRPAPALRDATAFSSEQRNDEHLNHHLPAPIWGHALDYLPYEEVRSALLLCKMIANEASKYVLALNFTKSCQLDGPSTRSRFANVEEVGILCLFQPLDDTNAETGPNATKLGVCRETVDRIVPFLTTFAKLRIISFEYPEGRRYRKSHNRLLRALMKNILGALKARVIPDSIESIDGLHVCMLAFQQYGKCPSKCSLCCDVCSYFPLGDIIDQDTGDVNVGCWYPCLDDSECYRILLQRPGGKEAIKELILSGDKLFHFLMNELGFHYLRTDTDEGKALKEKLEKLGAVSEEGELITIPIQYMCQRGFNWLDGLIGLGFDPKFVSKSDIVDHVLSANEEGGREYRLIARSTFDFLVSRGFDFDEKDVNIFDEKDDPGLREKIEENILISGVPVRQ